MIVNRLGSLSFNPLQFLSVERVEGSLRNKINFGSKTSQDIFGESLDLSL